ncbi:MAG: protein translocase subunit SecD [Akkermansiaceae bacterium]
MDLKDYPEIVVTAGILIVALIFWYVASEVDRRKRNVGSVAIGVVIALCFAAVFPPSEKLKGGIDLIGGSSFIVKIKPGLDDENNPIPVNPGAIEQVKTTLSKRLSNSGLSDTLMQPLGNDRLIIEMPGVGQERRDEIRETIEKTARLLLKEVHPDSTRLIPAIEGGQPIPPGYKVYPQRLTDEEGNIIGETKILLKSKNIVGGDSIQDAQPDPQQIGVVQVLLNDDGGRRVQEVTSKMRHKIDQMAIVFDGLVLSAPTVQTTLSRNFIVTGLDGKKEARELSEALDNPLKNPLDILSERNVTPRYGQEVIRQGVTAAIAGLGLTLVFVILYYRFAGLVALAGLFVNLLILFGAMAMFGATFTLPGIAGIILTIGVAVDANVLIYERLREEMASGKSLGNALKAAYEKAFSAIFDANITTLLTALILLWRASDQMKGFAITLTIGILSSMFAALLVTRVLFFWGSDTKVLKKLSFMNLIPEKTIRFMEMRKIAFMISGLLLIGSLVIMGTKQKSALGIDFLGGSIVNIQLNADQSLSTDEVRDSISDLTLKKNVTVQVEQPVGSEGDLVSIKCATEDLEQVQAELRKDIPLLSKVSGKVVKYTIITDEGPTKEAVETTLKELGIEGAETNLRPAGEKNRSLLSIGVSEEAAKTLPASLAEKFPSLEKAAESTNYEVVVDSESISASLGDEFFYNSLWALGIGLLAVLIYISLRFEFSFAIGAFAALFHDILIAIGIVILFGTELSLIHVGAFLTIAGYSINDTIVVFDRLRETLRSKRGDVASVMNFAINATLSRTILTSVTTFVAVLVLWIFGGSALKDFSFAIMIGVVVGTYSSIFIAAPVVYLWSKARGTNLRSELLDANLDMSTGIEPTKVD